MSFSVPNGTPGVLPTYIATAREVFYANRNFAQFLAGPLVVDGTFQFIYRVAVLPLIAMANAATAYLPTSSPGQPKPRTGQSLRLSGCAQDALSERGTWTSSPSWTTARHPQG